MKDFFPPLSEESTTARLRFTLDGASVLLREEAAAAGKEERRRESSPGGSSASAGTADARTDGQDPTNSVLRI